MQVCVEGKSVAVWKSNHPICVYMGAKTISATNDNFMCVCVWVSLCVWAAVMGTDLWSDRANLPSYCPALLVLSCSKWLSDQLALKLNTLTDLEENQNQFVPGPSIWSRPPRALELVTSPRCGIDVLTCKVRLKKRQRERGNKRGREKENEVEFSTHPLPSFPKPAMRSR